MTGNRFESEVRDLVVGHARNGKITQPDTNPLQSFAPSRDPATTPPYRYRRVQFVADIPEMANLARRFPTFGQAEDELRGARVDRVAARLGPYRGGAHSQPITYPTRCEVAPDPATVMTGHRTFDFVVHQHGHMLELPHLRKRGISFKEWPEHEKRKGYCPVFADTVLSKFGLRQIQGLHLVSFPVPARGGRCSQRKQRFTERLLERCS